MKVLKLFVVVTLLMAFLIIVVFLVPCASGQVQAVHINLPPDLNFCDRLGVRRFIALKLGPEGTGIENLFPCPCFPAMKEAWTGERRENKRWL